MSALPRLFFAARMTLVMVTISAAFVGPLQVARADGFGTMASWAWFDFHCLGQETCTTGDVNGDDKDDLIAFVRDTQANPGRGDVWVALSTGSGFDTPKVWVDTFCLGQETCTTGDVNGDGKDDLIAFVRDTQTGSGRGDVWVALSTGSGFDTPKVWVDIFCVGDETCTMGDMNGDGKDDIIAFVRDTQTNSGRGDVWVALSTGSGFGTPRVWVDIFCLGNEICATGDANGDGKDDLIAFVRDTQANPGRGDVWVALSTGSGFDTPKVWVDIFCVGQETCATGDVNGDGKDDIIAFVRDTQANPGRGDVWVALSTGSGFAAPSVWNDTFCLGAEICTTGDVNGDGQHDVIAFVRDSQADPGRGDVWVAFSNGVTFGQADLWNKGFCRNNEVCATGDVNGDGKDDIIAFVRDTQTNPGRGDVWVALSTGSSFSTPRVWVDIFCVGDETCTTGDVNGDGKDDLIAFVRDTQTNPGRGDVWVALSTGSSFSTPRVWVDIFCLGQETCTTGDVNGDGKDDLIAFVRDTQTGSGRGDVWVALSTGSGFDTPKVWVDIFCLGNEVCATGDANGDGKDDIIAFVRDTQANPGRGDVWVALSTGSGFDTPKVWVDIFCVGQETCATGDVNGDGKDDIIAFVRNTQSDPGRGNVWTSLSTGASFATPAVWADLFCLNQEECRAADFNGDGKHDIAAFRRQTGEVFVSLTDEPSAAEHPLRAEDFGYGSMRVEGRPAYGARPLLIIIASIFNSTLPHTQTVNYYESLVFGPAYPNVADYFREMSYGQFTWSKAGVIDARALPMSCPDLDTCGALAKYQASDLGFNFATYDRNADGRVTTDELGILIVDNATTTGGAERETIPNCVQPSSSTVQICSAVTGVGTRVGIDTLSHELAHLLGAVDLYGSASYSTGVTLMGATIGPDNARTVYHLDPWHKAALGWIRPRIYKLTDPGAVATLESIQHGPGVPSEHARPIILYDPRRGENEYFMLEYRNPVNPFGNSYDANVAHQGLAVWYVKLDASKRPLMVPGLELVAGDDALLQSIVAPGSDDVVASSSIYAGPDRILQSQIAAGSDDKFVYDNTVFLIGAPLYQKGVHDLWNKGQGPLELQLQYDQWRDLSGSGLRIRIGDMAPEATRIEIEWAYYGRLLRPYIDSIDKTSASVGDTLTIRGTFGVGRLERIVSLKGQSEEHDLEIVDWQATSVKLKVPLDVPNGTYQLVMYDDQSKIRRSNLVTLTIRANMTKLFIPLLQR